MKKTEKQSVETIEFKPQTFEKTLSYSITISKEGYEINVEPSVLDDLASCLIARNIAERFLIDAKNLKGMKIKGVNMKSVNDRVNLLLKTSHGLQVLSEDILKHLLRTTANELKAKKEK